LGGFFGGWGCIKFGIYYNITILRVTVFNNQKALGEISKDLGQVFFASVFISGLMIDKVDLITVLFGFILAIASWSVYIITRN
jgi:hypothetical protein